MESAVAAHLQRTARQVTLEGCRFDVVAYDKETQLFTIVECKRGRKAVDVGHAFGQISAYYALLARRGRVFVDKVGNKLPRMRYGRWIEATHRDRYIKVAFYVALRDRACEEQADVIRAVKNLLTDVGVIRVKADGQCRDYLKNGNQNDYRTAHARPMKIKLLQRRSKAWTR